MSNVIEFPQNDDFKNVSYIDDNGDLGVATRCRAIGIYRLNKNEFEIVTKSDISFILDRETLAEFLHVSQVFIDPEFKYKPELEMIACDY